MSIKYATIGIAGAIVANISGAIGTIALRCFSSALKRGKLKGEQFLQWLGIMNLVLSEFIS